MQYTHETTVTVEASPRDVYAQWSEINALPRVLSHLRATARDEADDLARLVIVLDGRHIEFAAQRTMCADDTICWQNLGTQFLYVLTIRIKPLGDGQTQITVNVAYDPPGFLRDILETLGMSKVFQHSLEADMHRYAASQRSDTLTAFVGAH